MVDGGYLSDERLDELKRKLRRLIYPRWVLRKWGDKLDIYYGYRKSPAEMMHTLSYCTNATFRDIDWDRRLASNLRGARYSGWWGKWDESPKWQLPESDRRLASLVSLEQGKCPECGSPIRWNKHLMPSLLIELESPTDLGNGYYLLPPIRPPPVGRLDFSNLIELPDGDYRKHSNAVRRSIDRARNIVSFLSDYESYS
ncbi:unnamed protein product [marine sediment metagenome]|uniref:Uncharacterized protein n=2 Tax=marine sediment metagenome TaxID=412755 RepID=X1QTC0_9ZZZZ